MAGVKYSSKPQKIAAGAVVSVVLLVGWLIVDGCAESFTGLSESSLEHAEWMAREKRFPKAVSEYKAALELGAVRDLYFIHKVVDSAVRNLPPEEALRVVEYAFDEGYDDEWLRETRARLDPVGPQPENP